MKQGFWRSTLCTLVFFSGLMAQALLAQTAGQVKSPVITPLHYQEKAYLHTDKAYYYQSEIIWFCAYMSYRSPGMQDTLSKVLYVDLINSAHEIVQSRIVQLNDGRGAGQFTLPATTPQGNYLIRAYTNWMRNYGPHQFYYKSIPILSATYTVADKSVRHRVASQEIRVSSNKPRYHRREKVELLIEPSVSNLVNGQFSMAVTDTLRVVPITNEPEITDDYQLDAELPPGTLSRFQYPIEYGVKMHGVYCEPTNRCQKTKLSVVQGRFEGFYQLMTNDTGAFVLKDLEVFDSVGFLFNNGSGKVTLASREVPNLPGALPRHHLNWISTNVTHSFFYGDNIDNSKLLKEVTIKARREPPKYDNPFGEPDYYVKREKLESYSSLAQAISTRIPQFHLVWANGHYRLVWIRSNAEPVVFIDGAQVFAAGGETIGDRLDSMNPYMIDHVEATGMINSNLGMRGSSGAIYIYSRRYEPGVEPPVPLVKFKGFDKPWMFKSPDYDNAATDKNLPDYRSTIYWNPAITLTAKQAVAKLSFFTADTPGVYRIVVEGVINNGTPVHTELTLTVEE